MAFLNRGVTIELADERDDTSQTFRYDGGIASYVEHLATKKEPVHDKPIYVVEDTNDDGISVEIALQWTEAYQDTLLCFANNIRNRDGGTHASAFKTALTRTLNQYATEEQLLKNYKGEAISGDDYREGLVAIVSVKLPDPTFSNQTKDKLLNNDVTTPVQQALSQGLR